MLPQIFFINYVVTVILWGVYISCPCLCSGQWEDFEQTFNLPREATTARIWSEEQWQGGQGSVQFGRRRRHRL